MTTLVFEKIEGLGNDFIVVDAEAPLGQRQVERLCDRHFGIGADGVLHVMPAVTHGARARMSVLNADGSHPEMCGNGLRCVALHLARQDGASAISYVIDTDSGPLGCEVERDGDLATVSVDMGVGRLLGPHRALFDGESLDFVRVSMGNPHAVLFDSRYTTAELDRLGPQISAEIAGGANVELVSQRSESSFDVVVWERGVGRTLACGTGAAATAVALADAGRAPFDEPMEIRLPGGALEIRVARTSLAVSVRGPARRVFSGETVLR